MVMQSQLSIGSLVAFTILMLDLFRPISVLSSFWDQFQQIIVSSERMDDILQAEPETGSDRNGLIELPRLRGHLRFSGVSFRYAPESRDVLQHLDLEVRPGQIIAIVGRSGSGKSTLIKLLLGFCLPSSGSITIDGFDLSTVWLPSIRRQVGLVPQDAHIYRDTVRNNLILSASNATYGEMVEAAKAAGAHDFISALPQGYDTMLEERGANLSGGQRQRISMARAILQDPRLLILDEATSALDSETERFVWGNLRTKFKDRTVLMIAHRLSTARHADVIVALDRGIIVEQGTHDELMGRRGLYFTFSTQRLEV
jgi:ATP-binding cassette subfamily B protein